MSTNEINAPDAGVADTLIRLLSEQRALYVRLESLTDSQRALITGDQSQKLLAVLGERQKLIDQLEQLAAKMRPYQEQWLRLRDTLAPEETERVDRLLSEVDALLAGILAKDKADAQLLAARKSVVGQAMTTIKTGKQAGAAYAASSGANQVSVEWTDP